MKLFIRYILLVFAGAFIGVLTYSYLIHPLNNTSGNEDSLFVETAQAQQANAPDVRSANENVFDTRHNAITQAVARVSPSVVSVNVLQVREYVRPSPFYSNDPFLRFLFPEYFQDRVYQEKVKSMGSGFIISSDGYILTNEHVIEDARQIVINMTDGTQAEAEIVGSDPTADIALLKVDLKNLPYAELGNSDDVIIGEWAIALGNPFGLFAINNKPTVTLGVISAVDRDFGRINDRIYQDMIQTDASINHGNSGGPLCNALGEVIGMNTFIYTGSAYSEGSVGIGFAIPINRIKRILEDLKKYHRVDRDFWIGLKIQELNKLIAFKLGYASTEGVLVTHVDRGSPAEKAGIEIGDIITEVGETKIRNKNDIINAIYSNDLKVGDNLRMRIWRDGKEKTVVLHLESIHEKE